MTDSRDLIVHVVGDNRKLTKTLKESEAQTTRFARRLEALNAGTAGRGGLGSTAALLKGGGIALGLGLAAKQVATLTQAASDLSEQLTKSRAIFTTSSATVEQWSRTTAQAIGVSRTAALEATGTFGNLFNTVGLTGGRAAAMSETLVKLAADLASFNNASPEDTLAAIRSGLVGEAEPLRRFGVLLSEVRVQQQAMSDTGKKSATALTQQEKALARYEIILKDTQRAQGDFGRTSGGLANQQRILKAELADTRAELGTRLLPAMVKVTKAANELIQSFHGTEASIADLQSADFRQKFADVFGIDKLKQVLEEVAPQIKQAREQFLKDITTDIDLSGKPKARPHVAAFGEPGFKVGKAPPVPLGPTAEQRNRIFDDALTRSLDRVQDSALQAQLVKLGKISETITQRISVTKDITRKLKLEDDLLDVVRQQKAVRDQLATQFLDGLSFKVDKAGATKSLVDDLAALKSLEDGLRARLKQDKTNLDLQQQLLSVEQQQTAAREQQRQNRIDAITARQFRTLGLDSGGNAVTPGVANLRKRLGNFTDAVKGTFLDTKKTESQLAQFRKVLSEALVPKDVRAKLAELLADLDRQLKDHVGKQTKVTSLNSNAIVAGLGISRNDSKTIQERLAKFTTAGTRIQAQPGAVGAFGGINVTVQAPDVFIDREKVSTSVRRSNTVHTRRNPKQKRGRRF